MDLFNQGKPKYTLPKRPRLFESFAGVGMQRMAFERLGIDYEMVGISEIDKYAIQSYMAIHGDTKNYGDITKIKGEDLPQIDIFTYSFPCQDLSNAGKGKGISEGTRSGLVYEVLRILRELKEIDRLPPVLMMENVIGLLSKNHIQGFEEIKQELVELGYTNYWDKLNAKDYGVAQSRNRVFMISILGDYYYEFPKPFKLEKRLKDYLEDEVDEKYYLSDKLLNFFQENSKNNEEKGNGFRFKPKDDDSIANTVTTLAGNRMEDNFIKIPEDTKKGYAKQQLCNAMLENGHLEEYDMIRHSYTNERMENLDRKESSGEISATLTTRSDTLGVVVPFGSYYTLPDNQGNINTQCNRASNVDGYALTVVASEPGKVAISKVNDNYHQLNGGKWDKMHDISRRVYNTESVSPTIHTMGGGNTEPKIIEPSVIVKEATKQGYDIAHVGDSGGDKRVIEESLRIRKLTPLECWRLMGIDDEDFYKAQSSGVSNSQLYKQAGNGLVVDVFAALISTMVNEQKE